MTLPPPAWYPDPNNPAQQRYWNGERWTDDFAPAGPHGYFIAAQPVQRYEPARGLATATSVLLAITALISIGAAVVSLDRASIVSDLIDNPLSVSLSDVESADDRVQAMALLGAASYLVTAIVFVIWFQRCYKNAQALGVSNLRFSSGWAAGAWFVPFLNLVRPKQIADDIWKSTDPAAAPQQNSEWMVKRVPLLFHAWWAFFIAGSVVGRVVASLANDSDSATEIRNLDRAAAVAQMVTVVGAILAILVVRAMTRRAEARAANWGVITPR